MPATVEAGYFFGNLPVVHRNFSLVVMAIIVVSVMPMALELLRNWRARRAEQATIVSGLKTVLESDEQLLGFARGRIAGGWRGKLNVGPEAFFAPFVNVGLTERRFVLQHIHPENGRPSEIMPHFEAE